MPQDTVDLEAILRQLTLEEKVSLVSACDWWRTPIVRRGEKVLIPHVKVRIPRTLSRYPCIIS